MFWVVVLCILVKVSPAKAPGCKPPKVHMVIAIDSTKMTTSADFHVEKEIVKRLLDLAKIKYALVAYTGDNATIYKDFGEDKSHNGASLIKLSHIKSTTYGFDFNSLFALKYNRIPDCLWLLRNNGNYSYPVTSLPSNPMGYDQRIPKVALNFGYPNMNQEMQNLTKFDDILFNGYEISDSNDSDDLKKMKEAICKYCKKIKATPIKASRTMQTTTKFMTTASTHTSNVVTKTQEIEVTPTWTRGTEPKTTWTRGTEPKTTTSTEPLRTEGASSIPVITVVAQTVTETVKPSKSFTTSPTSSKETSNTMEDMIKEYETFLSYNVTQVNLTNKDEIRKYIEISSRLLSKSHSLQESIQPQNESIGIRVLDKLERFCVSVGNTMATSGLTNTTIQVETDNIVVSISAVDMTSFKGFTFGDVDVNDGFISVPPVVFEAQEHQGAGVIVSMILEPFQSFIDSKSDNTTLAGKIVSVITQPHPTKTFYPPVTLRLKHKGIANTNTLTPSCVFWDFRERGWSTTGCSVTNGNASVTECQCNHMTHYAVLLSFDNKVTSIEHHEAMTVITYIGCSLSIVGVFLTLITFVCLPVLKSERTRIHCNLCIAIGLSQVLFLAAGNKELVENTIACKFYAALMFYCFMSVFSWMLVEGIHLYQMIIIAFISRSMMKFYYGVGWGLPAVIVVIASAITYKGYGSKDFCWISLQDGAILAFAVPAAIIILVNMAVLFCVLRLRVKLDGSSDVHKTVKTGARVSVVLLPLLGITWVFGFFSVLPITGLLFQYLFAISNSLQGFMIFLFHCVGNSEVRKEFHRKAEHWYSARTISSNSITMTANKVTPISVNDSINATTSR